MRDFVSMERIAVTLEKFYLVLFLLLSKLNSQSIKISLTDYAANTNVVIPHIFNLNRQNYYYKTAVKNE